MDPLSARLALGAAGAAGGAAAGLGVEDVFSTYLFEGDGGYNLTPAGNSVTVTNGIDLAGEGGLVWWKTRSKTQVHWLSDTERGTQKTIMSQSSSGQSTQTAATGGLTSFNSDGFTLGADLSGYATNERGEDYASWTFRKAPGFFDVVTYTGTGSDQTISHNLGSTPGCIIVKRTDTTGDWYVYHRSLTTATENWIRLNNTGAANGAIGQDLWGPPTSTTFKVDTYLGLSTSSATYVAYLFAHDEAVFGESADQSVIKCGSYTGNSSTTGNTVSLGWEPQWLMIKSVDLSATNTGWHIYDNMRGVVTGGDEQCLSANLSSEENGSGTGGNADLVDFNATGFTVKSNSYAVNNSSSDYIYIAIRRGPMKTPTDATEVFAVQDGRDASDGTASQSTYTSGFPVDLFVRATKGGDSSTPTVVFDRLRGQKYSVFASTAVEASGTFVLMDDMDGVYRSSVGASSSLFAYMFRRAPGFFDVVAYTGTGSLTGVNHNLGVTPELKIIKRRSATSDWVVGGSAVAGENGYIYLNSTAALVSSTNYWDGGDDSATQFSVRNTNAASDASGSTYIAYLFATVSGVSKVGSYSGTGSNINVDCGFSAGARFVLIKRIDSTGDWYVWNTARGIVAGDDPYYLWNAIGVPASTEVTNTDYIDPLNAGFTITSSAPAALNASGGDYLFLAIA